MIHSNTAHQLMLATLLLASLNHLVVKSNDIQQDSKSNDEETVSDAIIKPIIRPFINTRQQLGTDSSNYNNYYYGYRNDDQRQTDSTVSSSSSSNKSGLPRQDDQYLIGVGIADITGPAADINLMGYAKPNQDSGGIHLRQFSRTIILGDSQGSRIVYTSIDNGMVSQLLRLQVLKQLNKKYKGIYNANNVMISATHSHSCPGGFFQFVLFNIPSQGFIAQTLEALVNGMVKSIDRAHDSIKLGYMYYTEGTLLGASINRSPTAYENNPESERAQYQYDTDKEMVLVRLTDLNGNPIAMMNWFPVHGTSMNNTNHLISGDNKGYASILFEEQYNNDALPGKGEFVAIFAQSNEGDVSPNTRGSRCIDTGLPCDSATSTCGVPPRIFKRSRSLEQQQHSNNRDFHSIMPNGKYPEIINQPDASIIMQQSSGTRGDDFSAFNSPKNHLLYQNRQYQYLEPASNLYRQQYNDKRFLSNARQRRSSWPARALQKTSFVSSMFKPASRSSQPQEITNEKCVSSGPGRDMFESTKIIAYKQYYKARELFNDVESQIKIRGPIKYIHQHIDMTSQVIKRDSDGNITQITCLPALGYSFAAGTTDGPGAFDFQQGDTSSSEMNFPYAWHPTIVPTQILMLGQMAIVGLPGEFTTMAGRRIRNAISCVLNNESSNNNNDCYPNPANNNKDDITHNADSNYEFLTLNTGNTANNAQDETTQLHRKHVNKRDVQEQQSHLGKTAITIPPTQVKVVLSGLSNIYTSYITTYEEYLIQRYEGASTIYGPYTLEAYLMQFTKLARLLKNNQNVDEPGPDPTNLLPQQIVLKPGVIFDSSPYGKHFGDILIDVDNRAIYRCQDTVRASFVAGHPRNDLRHEGTFMTLERYNNDTKRFDTIASDSSWDTKFIWRRTNSFLGESEAILEWNIPHDCKTGIYRMRHFGASKNLVQQVKQYSGKTSAFQVLSNVDSQDELTQLMNDYDSANLEENLETLAIKASNKPININDQQARSSFSPLAILSSIFTWKH